MGFYQKLATIGSKFIGKDKLFKYGFNFSPMYRRSTAKISNVSKDLLQVDITLPISYKNKNYVGSIFGGSLFSAVDPIPMVQLIHLLSDEYIVWDKSAQIFFKKPARADLYASFIYTAEELTEIKKQVALQKELEIVKTTLLVDRSGLVHCKVLKTIYIAEKSFYKQKINRRKE